jgi:opacity protein-like surface antigen
MLRRLCGLYRSLAAALACVALASQTAAEDWQAVAPLTDSEIASSCKCGGLEDYSLLASDCWYVSFSGGWQDRQRAHEVGDPSTFIVFDDGFAANLAFGYRFDPIRVEVEYTFMNNECDRAGSGGLASSTVGNVNLKALMFNAYYDLDLDCTCWRPYFGAGVGIFQSEINGLYPEFFEDPALAGLGFAGNSVNATSDLPFAWQARIGASRPLTASSEFYFGYRYFDGSELTFSSAPFAQFSPTFHPNGAENHSVEFGVRVSF